MVFYIQSSQTFKKYENFMKGEKDVSGIAKVVSSKEEKNYKEKYIVKFKNKKFILYADKNSNLEYGDIIYLTGSFEKAHSSHNFGGFDYERYLRQNKIYGILKIDTMQKIGKEKDVVYYLERMKQKLKKNLFAVFHQEQAGFLIGLLLGDKSEVFDETTQDFRNSSLSHILALSGLHVIYVSFGIKFLLDFITPRQRFKNFLMILFLIFFAIFTGGSPSCVRACIMSSMVLLSKILYRKNDFLTSLLIALDIILCINCYHIESLGMWLSFLATFGLVYIRFQKEVAAQKPTFLLKLKKKMMESIQTSLSCNLMIFPLIWNSYNTFSFTFFISNFFASFLIGPIIALGYIHLFLGKFSIFFSFFEIDLLNILFHIAKVIGDFPFSKIFVPSIPICFWIIYYICILSFVYFHQRKEMLKSLINDFKNKLKYGIYLVVLVRDIAVDFPISSKTKFRNTFFRCWSRRLFFCNYA